VGEGGRKITIRERAKRRHKERAWEKRRRMRNRKEESGER
jgi:hypothetical protein